MSVFNDMQYKGPTDGDRAKTNEYTVGDKTQWRFMPYEPDSKGGKYDIVYREEGVTNQNYNYIKSKNYAPTTSFSGTDMSVQFVFPGARPVTIGTASTISYSIFRETTQIRTLGRISTRGITRGPRTVAGNLIFTVVNQHIVNDIMDVLRNDSHYAVYDRIKPDELPSFDIVITFANEYGQTAHMVIYGVHIFEESKTLSVEDIFTENVMTFKGRDIDHMKGPWRPGMYEHSGQVVRGSNEPVAKFDINDATNTATAYHRTLTQLDVMRVSVEASLAAQIEMQKQDTTYTTSPVSGGSGTHTRLAT